MRRVTPQLWIARGHQRAIIDEPWPRADDHALARDRIDIVVQVNGKLRAQIAVPADADRDTVQRMALACDNVARFVGSREVRRVIVVPGRLVNVVV